MPGRSRKPTARHELEGTRPNASNRDRSNEPKDLPPLGDWPEHWHALDPELRAQLVDIWHEVANRVPSGVLTDADRFALELVVGLLWQWRHNSPARGVPARGFGGLSAADTGTLKTMLGLLGMTPADRSKVSASVGEGDKTDDPWHEI